MSKQSLFFQEATLILSGSLNISGVLEPFLKFLQTRMPVTRLGLGRGRPELEAQEVVVLCSEDGALVTPVGEMAALSPAQLAMRPEIEPMWSNPDGVLVRDADHPLARYLALGQDNFMQARAPFFWLRLAYPSVLPGKQGETPPGTVGTVVFECPSDNLFKEKHLELLRSLRLPLRLALDNCLQHRALRSLKDDMRAENERLRQELSGLSSVRVIGSRAGLAAVMERVGLAAAVDVPVLITGETGTGKELMARAVHDLSPRRTKAFVAVNCGGIPSSLIDSELFGHVKGAFTGAINNHKGRFERAHGGTIFLDEIGELPLDVQARLLRVLQEMSIERVGGSAAVPVDFRLVAATNRDLESMVREGKFREDLFYRLNVVPIRVPPLRERPRDIPLLVEHMIRRAAARFDMPAPLVAPGELEKLMAYRWPGNVRELQNTVEEALVLMPKGPLRFRSEGRQTGNAAIAPEAVPAWDAMQRSYFQSALRATGGRINGDRGAAALTGLNPSTFRFKLVKLGIPYGRNG